MVVKKLFRMQRFREVLCWLMGLLYVAAGVNHFWHPDFYVNIMPPYLPWHLELVYLSGLAEIVLGLLVIIARYRVMAAWCIVAMLIVFMMVHVHMVMHQELYPSVSPALLWLRLPLQGLLILWAYWYTQDRLSRPDQFISQSK